MSNHRQHWESSATSGDTTRRRRNFSTSTHTHTHKHNTYIPDAHRAPPQPQQLFVRIPPPLSSKKHALNKTQNRRLKAYRRPMSMDTRKRRKESKRTPEAWARVASSSSLRYSISSPPPNPTLVVFSIRARARTQTNTLEGDGDVN